MHKLVLTKIIYAFYVFRLKDCKIDLEYCLKIVACYILF